MNARKIMKEKKAVTHTWLTKVFSTRLFHSGKIRSQAMSQRQSTWICLWPLVKLRMSPAISREVEFTLLEIFIWILPGLEQQLWAIGKIFLFLGKNQDQVKNRRCAAVRATTGSYRETQYSARSCQPDCIHMVFSSSGQPPLLLCMSTSSWRTDHWSFWVLLPTVITNRLPYFDMKLH